MAKVTFQGNEVLTVGELPVKGGDAPDFLLTKTDLTDISLNDFKGKRIVLNIFPSVDTPVCASTVRRFNNEINQIDNAVCLCASVDLPFAHSRFCGAEGLENVVSVSELRNRDFGDSYGVRITSGPLAGLFVRAVVIIDEEGKVIHSELVPEITEEPDYEAALNTLR